MDKDMATTRLLDLGETMIMLRSFSFAFDAHLLPAYLSEKAIRAVLTLPQAERDEIVHAIVGYAGESHTKTAMIIRAAKPKRAPKWLKLYAERIADDRSRPVATVTIRNTEVADAVL